MSPSVPAFSLASQRALVTGCSRGIGQALAVGLAEAGADILGISASLPPSGSDTERLVRALRQHADRSQSMLGRITAGRWGTPADSIGPIVFLASAASTYVHGTILTVDGGWMGR